jgi:hypothetical protein
MLNPLRKAFYTPIPIAIGTLKGTLKLADFQLFPLHGQGVRTIENKKTEFSDWIQY